ncbi:MAG TPA: hypothetical protein VFI37_12200 [Gaiellaceae bacterium]|nr:hypothetical protein [Gaiellaceae bacterium]
MDRALTTSWLASRLGLDPLRVHALRRSGSLVAYRKAGGNEYLFPAWQFDAEWRPLPVIARLTAAAREAGLSDERLHELMNARVGIGGTGRLLDLVRSGDEERLLATVRAARASAPS